MKHTLTPFVFFFFGAAIGVTGGLGKTNLQLGPERFPVGVSIIFIGCCFLLTESTEMDMSTRPGFLKMAVVPSLLAASGWCFLSSSPDNPLIPFIRLDRAELNMLGGSLILFGLFYFLLRYIPSFGNEGADLAQNVRSMYEFCKENRPPQS